MPGPDKYAAALADPPKPKAATSKPPKGKAVRAPSRKPGPDPIAPLAIAETPAHRDPSAARTASSPDYNMGDMAWLWERHQRLRQLVNMAIAARPLRGLSVWLSKKTDGKVTSLDDADFRVRLAAVRKWAADPTDAQDRNNYSNRAQTTLAQWMEAANEAKANPLELIDFLQSALVPTQRLGTALSSAERGRLVDWIESARKVKLRDGSWRHIVRALSSLYDYSGSMPVPGFTGVSKVKPLSPKNLGTKRVYAMEVASIEYLLPRSFDANGKPERWVRHEHITAAEKCRQIAKTYGEYKALLGMTAAGRLWLCWTEDRRSMFFATDRKPSRPLLATGESMVFESVLYGGGLPTQTMMAGLIV